MEGNPPNEEDEVPTNEVVDGLELIFGRVKSGYKDVYPHRKGWQAKITLEDSRASAAWASSRTRSTRQLLWPEQSPEAYSCSPTQIRLGPNLASEVRASLAVPHLPALFPTFFSVTPAARFRKVHREAQTFFDTYDDADVSYGISRELIDADYTSTGAAAWVGWQASACRQR